MKSKKFLIKLLSIVCSAMLLFLSPCARYIDAKSIDKVYAIPIAPALGGEAAVASYEILLAFLASIAAGEIVIEHPESVLSPFALYVANNYGDSIDDTCMNIYNKATGTIESISWGELIDSLSDAHDLTVDNLTDLYAQYCPALLESFEDFITDILNGDIYVEGISNALVEYENISEEDIAAQELGKLYTASFMAHSSYDYTNSYTHRIDSYVVDRWFNTDIDCPIAVVYNTSMFSDGLLEYNLYFYKYNRIYHYINYLPSSYINMWVNGVQTRNNEVASSNFSWGIPATSYSNQKFSLSGNIPIFASKELAQNYLMTGEGYENALNYGSSIYDDIESNVDIPPFHRGWQQEFWERIANSPDVIGIGSYGHGVYNDNWGDDIPWIGLESLQEYSRSLLDIYNQIIDDILNGTYDSSEDIPGTYSEAWEKAISDAWQDVVEQSTGSVPEENESDKPTEGEGKDESTDGEDTNPEESPEGEEHRFTEEEIQEILNDIKGDGFKSNPLRQAYEDEVRALKDLGEELLAGGKSLEEVARTLWQARRDLGIKYKDMTPELLREYIYEINLNRYGDKLGPSFEYFTDKLGKSFQEIIDSSSKPNSDIDKLLEGFEEWLRSL